MSWCFFYMWGLAYSYLEVGAHSANYADEVPPPWESTCKTDFCLKPLNARETANKNRESMVLSPPVLYRYLSKLFRVSNVFVVADFVKESHFSLEGGCENDVSKPISTTKRDFPGLYGKPRDPCIPPQVKLISYIYFWSSWP
jgi:hypothetical protein